MVNDNVIMFPDAFYITPQSKKTDHKCYECVPQNGMCCVSGDVLTSHTIFHVLSILAIVSVTIGNEIILVNTYN